jgi:helicase MOV-10
MDKILSHELAPIPYLIEGPLTHDINGGITKMLILIKDVVVKIYESCNDTRVLVCAPTNRACDSLMRHVMENVCTFDLFRANAAFRDKDLAPDGTMPTTLLHGECFTCPTLKELKDFRIITSTFVSAFRLCAAGIQAGHFSHIFFMDASSAIEPEMTVALADLATEETVIVVTGSEYDKPKWVRSYIGRNYGLRKSFFERLLESVPYNSNNPLFITHIR